MDYALSFHFNVVKTKKHCLSSKTGFKYAVQTVVIQVYPSEITVTILKTRFLKCNNH